MNEFKAFTPITRRALSINYISPLICMLSQASGSSSGGDVVASLDIDPVVRRPGPASLDIVGNTLFWSTRDYIYSYVVYYASAEAGPFQMLTSNVQNDQFTVSGIAAGDYWFKVTGVENTAGETYPSPVVGPAPIT